MLAKCTYALFSINKRRNLINTNPDYQRPAVWTKQQKQYLIDSILKGFDIPKIYLHKVGEGKYNVIDGQQRLRTIWEFYDDKFALSKDAGMVEGIDVSCKTYSQLDAAVTDIIDSYSLDFVVIENKSDNEIREMFLRLQNGTNLKSQEKRNAIPSQMRDFVKKVAKHNFFTKVAFKNSRFTFDLISAQMCLLALNHKICNIKDKDLNNMYWNNIDFDENNTEAKNIFRTLNYLDRVFDNTTPELKRYNVMSLFILVMDMLENYDIRGKEKDIYKWFVKFEQCRALDSLKPADEQDPQLVIYHEKTSNSSDSVDSLSYRHNYLKNSLLTLVANLPLKDSKRNFDEIQRQVIYRRDGGICKNCGKKCEWNEWGGWSYNSME